MENIVKNFEEIKKIATKHIGNRTQSENATLDKFKTNLVNYTEKSDEIPSDVKTELLKYKDMEGLDIETSNRLKEFVSRLEVRQRQGNESNVASSSIFDDLEIPTNIVIHTQAANEMTPSQCEEFAKALNEFIKKFMFKLPTESKLTKKQLTTGMYAFFTAANEQSTSKGNGSNKNLSNNFTLDGVEYEWNFSHAFPFFDEAFIKEKIQNPIRRYMRAKSQEIDKLLITMGYVPSGRLAAQWGVVDGLRDMIGDAVPLYKKAMTADQFTSQLAATEQATNKKGQANNVVHVSQVLGRTLNRR
nr:MAG: coat protein [Grapevine leafroll-associated virus 7]